MPPRYARARRLPCSEMGKALIVALAVVLVSYAALVAGLALVGRRAEAQAVARFVPDCAVLFKRLLSDPRVPRWRKLALGVLVLYLASPIDLVPDFLPGIGQLDDAVLLGVALRVVVRGGGIEVVREAWPGPQASLTLVLRAAGLETNGAATPPTTL
jgi:uncharacterized membrane protein YkvA (DUF1232 family)